jgi:hypothetical protein
MTKIYKGYSEFATRENKDDNGVSESFAAGNPEWEKQNEKNEACWSCSDCSNCYGCSNCSDCYGCYGCSGCSYKIDQKTVNNPIPGFPEIPVVENIHQKVCEAVTMVPDALDMNAWHICDTIHCRAGWVTYIAGEAGRILEEHTSTEFAAMQIYKASSKIRVFPPRFYDNNEKALEDIKRCAEEEKPNNNL